jgi:hypothetical protein
MVQLSTHVAFGGEATIVAKLAWLFLVNGLRSRLIELVETRSLLVNSRARLAGGNSVI